MDDKHKRLTPRAQVNRPARIRISNGPESNTQLIEISETGAALFYSQPVPVGTAVELRFHLNTGEKIACTTYGRVRHYTAVGESHVLGMEFTHFAPETVDAIRQYVNVKAGNTKLTGSR